MLGLIGKGLIIGVLVSAPMGPVGVLCLQRTLSKGRWCGFFTGLGATLSDVIYAAVTCLGMGVVVSFIESNHDTLQIAGSIVLGLFGLYTFMYNPVINLKSRKEGKLSYTQDFVTGFFLTFSNILIVLFYIGLFAHFEFVNANYSGWMLAGGLVSIGAGAVLWWFGITYAVSKIRKWFNIRGIRVLNRTVGSLLIIIAVAGLALQIIQHIHT
jgi:threonine/homoserine/homoserine lactone efflux protein